MGNGVKDEEEQLTIQGLIDLLASLKRAHGDLPVVINDADSNWNFKLLAKSLEVCSAKKGGRERLVIGCTYSDPYMLDSE